MFNGPQGLREGAKRGLLTLRAHPDPMDEVQVYRDACARYPEADESFYRCYTVGFMNARAHMARYRALLTEVRMSIIQQEEGR